MSKYAFLKALEVKRTSVKSEVQSHKDERAITHYITTKDMDWGGHIVNPDGMDSKMFEKHGTVFYNHDYSLPIASNMWLKKDDKGVLVKTRFAKTLFADDIYMMHEDKILKTWSIGWQPQMSKGELVEGALDYNKETDVLNINLWDLVEYSSAPLAMNPSALDQVKSVVKSNEAKGMIDIIKADVGVKTLLEQNEADIKSLLSSIEKQKTEIELYDARVEILESELAEMQDEFTKFMKEVKAEARETLGETKKSLDDLITGKVSSMFGK